TVEMPAISSQLRYLSHRQHPTGVPESINIIGPMLHHGTALAEVLRTVIGGAHGIALFMGKLALDHVRPEAHFIEGGRSQRPEAMNRCSAVIAHAVQGIEHRVVAHASFPRGRRK